MGAAIPEASITVTNADTNSSRSVVSDESGNYTVSVLPVGNYRLLVEKAGFASKTEDHLILSVAQSLSIDVPLATGSVSQTVTVEANAELLDASSSELGTVIDEKTIHDLPLNGRNFTQLLTLTPGATPVSTSQGSAIGNDDGSTVALPGSGFSNPSVNGQQNRSTLILFDGVVNTDFRTTTYTVLPIIDAISEFKVVSHNDDAQYGSVLGGVVNLVSKSGTNKLHGAAWEFVRNDVFDARDSFSETGRSAPLPFRQNEFGGVLGGPIRIPKLYDGRNKTFFFFGYEGWRYRKPPGTTYYSPTDAELNGDFSNSLYSAAGKAIPIYDPNTTTITGKNPTTGNMIYGRSQFSYGGMANKIDPARINAQTQNYLKTYYDKPNVTGATGYNTILTAPLSNDANDFHGRLDQDITDRDSVFFRWSTMGVSIKTPTNNNIDDDTVFQGENIGGAYTHIVSPNLLLDVRGGKASRPFTFQNISSKGTSGLTGFSSVDTSTYGAPSFTMNQFYASVGIGAPQFRSNSSESLTGSLHWTHGKHDLNFGSGYVKQFRTQVSNAQSYNFDIEQTGQPSQAGSPSSISSGTGNALASALLALPASGGFSDNNGYKDSMLSWFAFVSDSFKVSPRLTVNLGLRFDYLDNPVLKSGLNSEFDPETGQWLIGGGKLPSACVVTGRAPCIPGKSADASADLAAVLGYDGSVAGSHIAVASNPVIGPNSWFGVGPRFGFAFKATQTMVVRGGYGIVYDDLSGISQTFSNPMNSWPANGSYSPNYNTTFASAQTTVASSQATLASPTPSSTPFASFGHYFDPNMKRPYSEQFDVGIEQTVHQNTLLSISYVGAVSRRLDYSGIDNVEKTPGLLASKPYPYMTYFASDESRASSSYNALQVKFEQHATRGLQYLVSYTWSKSIDDSSGLFDSEDGSGGTSAVQNFYDPASNRSVSGYDVPHFLSISGLYDLPVGKGKRFLTDGLASDLLGGWQLNTLTQLRTGQPYTLQVSGDIASVGDTTRTYGRPNLVSGAKPERAHPTKTEWFNPAAFTIPSGSYGNFPRNALRSASVYNSDFALLKNFAGPEETSLQFRAEYFNVFNMINYAPPNLNISSSNAGTVTSTELPPRELQLALKLSF